MKPTSAPAGSALARLFESRREIRKLERETAELRKNKDQEIEKLTAEIVRHKELLEFYSEGVQSKENVIGKAIDCIEAFMPPDSYPPRERSLLSSILEILKAEAKN